MLNLNSVKEMFLFGLLNTAVLVSTALATVMAVELIFLIVP